jgi:hypothetical protein
VDLVFDVDPQVTAKRQAVVGDITRQEFDRRFAQGRHLNQERLEHLASIFAEKSFPETFFHPQLARALVATGRLTRMETAKQRITETGAIITSALDPKRGLAIMLGIGRSHDRRTRELYNEDTVEFTLLTLSYYGAKASGVREAEWFFYWRVFGSMMGLPPRRLHDTYDAARQRMSELHQQCDVPLNLYSRQLLETLRKNYLATEDAIRDACYYGLVSKRMERYLKDGNYWPVGLPNRHEQRGRARP